MLRDLEEKEKIISEVRQELYTKINEKGNLLDIEVIIASQKLDKILNEYNQLIKKE